MTLSEMLTELWQAIVDGLTTVPLAMVSAIKELFSAFVFDGTGETQTISFIGYFLFGVLGLSIGIGLIWLIISIFKRRG